MIDNSGSQPVHPVSDTDPCLDKLRMRGVFLNFFPQGSHKDSEGSYVAVESVSPYGVRKVSVRQCFAYVLAEQAEQFVLDRCQGQLLATDVGGTGRKIHLQVAVLKNVGMHASLQGTQPPLRDAKSRQKLIDGESIDIEGGHLLSRYHSAIEGKLKELKKLFIQYYPQQENNEKLNSVIISIYQAEEELSIHCLVEDNIFTPAVRRLEHHNKQNRGGMKMENCEDTTSASDEQLSVREKEIVVCVAKGMANKEIADKLYLSINTVTTHRRNIARKLNIHSSAGITIYAIVNKLVTLEEVNM